IFVGDRCPGIIAHAGGAHFVDDTSGSVQSIVPVLSSLAADHLSAHIGEDLLKAVLHVLGLFTLIIGPFVVEAQYGYAPFVHCGWVDLAIIVLKGYGFATATETHHGAVILFGIAAQHVPISAHFGAKEFVELVHVEA